MSSELLCGYMNLCEYSEASLGIALVRSMNPFDGFASVMISRQKVWTQTTCEPLYA
jgi:hypothetical protein